MGGLGLANFGEVFWVTMQQWRGVPSHFNYATPFDAAAFAAAGIMISVTASVIGLVMLWSWFSLQAPHALTLHAIQLLPTLAVLLHFTGWKESRRTRVVLAASGGYCGLTALSIWQAFNGLAIFDLGMWAGLLLGGSLVLVAGTGILAAAALRETALQSRQNSPT